MALLLIYAPIEMPVVAEGQIEIIFPFVATVDQIHTTLFLFIIHIFRQKVSCLANLSSNYGISSLGIKFWHLHLPSIRCNILCTAKCCS